MKKIAIVGPTGVGKTDLGIELALRYGGEIISVDSRQVFKKMDIGTAKPTIKERGAVVHWMLDIVEPLKLFSAGEFAFQASCILKGLVPKDPVWFVGGSGFYLKAFQDAIYLNSKGRIGGQLSRKISAELDLLGIEFGYNELKKQDPFRAKKIHPNDRYRIARSLEEILRSGRPMSTLLKGNTNNRYEWLVLGIHEDRDKLCKRILDRASRMFKIGLLEEVQTLVDGGYSSMAPFRFTAGYDEGFLVLQGKLSKAEAINRITNIHLKLVKKQLTWFKNKVPGIIWVDLNKERQKIDYNIKLFLSK